MGFGNLLKRWWPGDESEGNYTDRILAADYHAVLGKPMVMAIDNATRLAALTASRCAIDLSGDLADAWRPIVRPGRFVALMVEDLLRHGNAVYEITSQPALLRVSDFDVHGKRRIRYRISHSMPDGTTEKTVLGEAVLHVKINEDRVRPWLGRSPFEGTTLLATIEAGLLDYARIKNKRIVAAPTPATNMEGKSDAANANELLGNVFSRAGTEVFSMQTTRGSMDTLKSTDLIFAPDPAAIELRDKLVAEVYESIGIPPTLRGDAVPGQAYKTSLAAWIDGFLQPLADSIAEQMTAALEVDVRIDMSKAKIAQVGDQSRVVADLVKAGVTLDEAKTIAGL